MQSRESCWGVSGCPTDFLSRSSHSPEGLVENSMGLLHTVLRFSVSFLFRDATMQLRISHVKPLILQLYRYSLHVGVHIVQRISWEISFKILLHGDLHHDNPEGTSRSPKISPRTSFSQESPNNPENLMESCKTFHRLLFQRPLHCYKL